MTPKIDQKNSNKKRKNFMIEYEILVGSITSDTKSYIWYFSS
jgi:hypothetical protein